MAYDLVIKNGNVIDGSGLPGFHGDVAVSGGRIVEIGKVNGPARQTLNADGMVVSPGIIDNHTHYDAQVTWDPLCTYSCYHGVTTVVMGNCSLAMAPAHKEDRANLAGVLSHVEAIPLEAIQAGVNWTWETIPEYLNTLEQKLGINVAALIGHSAVRRYVMGEASQERHAKAPAGERNGSDERPGLVVLHGPAIETRPIVLAEIPGPEVGRVLVHEGDPVRNVWRSDAQIFATIIFRVNPIHLLHNESERCKHCRDYANKRFALLS